MNPVSKSDFYRNLPNAEKALYLLILSPELCFDEKLKLIFSSRVFYEKKQELIRRILPQFKREIVGIREKSYENLSSEDKETLRKIEKYPTKTTIQGLDFLNENKEKELMFTNSDNTKLITMIAACLGERYHYKTVQKGYEFLFNFNLHNLQI